MVKRSSSGTAYFPALNGSWGFGIGRYSALELGSSQDREGFRHGMRRASRDRSLWAAVGSLLAL